MDHNNMFNDSELYTAVTTNNVTLFRKLVDDTRQKHLFQRLSSTGETYLHLAIQKNCDLVIIKGLIGRVRLGQRKRDCKTALELALDENNQESLVIAQLHQEYILDCIKDGKVQELEELVMDGWTYWPIKGMPEFETFAEAPVYLGQGIMDVELTNLMYIYTKKQLKEFVEKDLEDEHKHLAKQRDPLGLSLLHKAVLFRDTVAVIRLLKHKHIEELLALQDNMGRTPLHYSSCFSEHSEIKILLQDKVELMSLGSLKDIVDKTGYTPMDYVQKKARIDTKKVLNLALAVSKVEDLSSFFGYIAIESSDFDADDYGEVSLLIKNCNGTALVDVTGRNILHKLIIFGNSAGVLESARNVMLFDKDNVLFKGQDLWGRTPMHYAYMLNHTEAIQMLNTKRGNLATETINEVKLMQDHEGKTIDGYHLEEEDAKALAKNLQDSLVLLHKARPVMLIHQKILKSIVSATYSSDSPLEDFDFESDSDDEFNYDTEAASLKLFNPYYEDEGQLILSIKDCTGSTLAHYAVRLNNRKLQEMIQRTDTKGWILKVRDNLGRTPFNFLSCLPEGSEFREWMKEIIADYITGLVDSSDDSDLSDTSDVEADASVDSSDDGDLSDTSEDDASEEKGETRECKSKLKKEADNKKGALLMDLMGKTPQEECLHVLRMRLEKLKLGTRVKVSKVTAEKKGVIKIQVNGSGVNSKQSPSVKAATFSAAHRCTQNSSSKPQVVEDVTAFDSDYLKKELGVMLTGALSDISLTHPADPIEYLALYLYKHAENKRRKENEKKEKEQLILEEEAAEKARIRRDVMRQEKQKLNKMQVEEARSGTEKSAVIKEEDEG